MHCGKHIADASTLSAWRKSSYSGGSNGSCLEITDAYPAIAPVCDSKNPGGPALVFPADGWASFVTAIKGGNFPQSARSDPA
ncbi:DUF397 domain-containing protein [Streptomyces gobiensis]|uniref:DUF397 domain-containing protein n=1 Tax=Streptomyces gobiensis TaxID=2875706 RepID=UPI001E4AF56F|nr:DUF397 domain-containing protein [Streptomyces gobiensis]UGY94420.1 DUF397 domain-containing protein [Streptomyces gobiensis]